MTIAIKLHISGRTTKNNVPLEGKDFPVLGAGAPPQVIHRYVLIQNIYYNCAIHTACIVFARISPLIFFCCCSMVKPTPVSLKEDDFPSLVHSGTKGSTPMTPAYVAQARKPSSFQEEDFPALVSKIRPQKPQENTTSAWSQGGSKPGMLNNKPVVLPTKTHVHNAPVFSARDPPPSSTIPQAHASYRKKKLTAVVSGKATSQVKSPISSDDEDLQTGKNAQESRAVPTMLDISSMLTVKTGSSQPNNKNIKKKRQPSATTSMISTNNVQLVTTAAHKENVPETKPSVGSVPKVTAVPMSNMFINGYKEKPKETKDDILSEEPPAPKKQPISQPPMSEEEDFPALITRKPPPGMIHLVSLKKNMVP